MNAQQVIDLLDSIVDESQKIPLGYVSTARLAGVRTALVGLRDEPERPS